jgi:hypothetical protein
LKTNLRSFVIVDDNINDEFPNQRLALHLEPRFVVLMKRQRIDQQQEKGILLQIRTDFWQSLQVFVIVYHLD